jgi:hypothetical protein
VRVGNTNGKASVVTLHRARLVSSFSTTADLSAASASSLWDTKRLEYRPGRRPNVGKRTATARITCRGAWISKSAPPWRSFEPRVPQIRPSASASCAGCRQIESPVRQCHNTVAPLGEPRIAPPVCFMPNRLGNTATRCAARRDPRGRSTHAPYFPGTRCFYPSIEACRVIAKSRVGGFSWRRSGAGEDTLARKQERRR